MKHKEEQGIFKGEHPEYSSSKCPEIKFAIWFKKDGTVIGKSEDKKFRLVGHEYLLNVAFDVYDHMGAKSIKFIGAVNKEHSSV